MTATGALAGALWWWLLPVRKRLAIANFRAAFPDRDPADLRRTVGELVEVDLDLARGRRARVVGLDLVAGGGIALAGHGGAWDLGLISAAREVPVSIFVRPPKNPLARRVITALRRRADLELLAPRGSMDQAYRALERGRVVVFVQDQRYNQGIEVPFFSRPARTSAAFAAMAWRSRAPLYGAWQGRDDDGSHWLTVERLPWTVPADREEAIRVLTRRSQAFYEDKIRIAPHRWLWLHDRWKSIPAP